MWKCMLLMLEASGNSRGSNKWWNKLIYTPKHVLHLLEHPPIIGAKIQKCFSMLSPDTTNSDLWEPLRHKYTKKSILLCAIIYLKHNLLHIYKGVLIVVQWWAEQRLEGWHMKSYQNGQCVGCCGEMKLWEMNLWGKWNCGERDIKLWANEIVGEGTLNYGEMTLLGKGH